MQFTNCTTRKPLFHESYGSWTCIYTPSPSNDMQFTNCTTRKPLFHDPYELYESYGSWTCIYTPSPSNDMQFTNCTTRTGRGLVYTPQVPLMIHRKLFKIPSWESNGKFSLYWENPGTRNSFLGKILGISHSQDLLNGFLLGI